MTLNPLDIIAAEEGFVVPDSAGQFWHIGQTGPRQWTLTAPDGTGQTVAVRASDDSPQGALATLAEAANPPADALAAQAAAARLSAAREECSRRIYAVAPETTQMNLASCASAGLLPPADLDAYRAGLGWIAAMRATWRPLAAGSADPYAEANWPPVPAGVAALTARF